MKKFLCILLIVALATALLPTGVSASALPFSDVEPNAWYIPGITYVLESGLMKGVSSQHFAPHKAVTRSMMVTVLWRLAGSPKIDYEALNSQNEYWILLDIPTGAYYETAALWAKSTGIMEGYSIPYDPEEPPTGLSAYTFRPDNVLTREQLATVLYRYATWAEKIGSVSALTKDFPDSDTTSPWAREAMGYCIGAGLIQGTSHNGLAYLNPKGATTRGQLATILMRFADPASP